MGPKAYRIDPTGTAWTYSGSAGVAGNGSAFTSGNPSAPKGTQVGVIQQTGQISQSITLAAGTYTVSFAAAQRGNCPIQQPDDRSLRRQPGGRSLHTGRHELFDTDNRPIHGHCRDAHARIRRPQPSGGDNTAFIDQVTVNQPALQNVAYMQDPDFASPSVGVGTSAYETDPTGSPWTFTGTAGLAGNGSAFTSGNPPAPVGLRSLTFRGRARSVKQSTWLTAFTTITFAAAQRLNNQPDNRSTCRRHANRVCHTKRYDLYAYLRPTTSRRRPARIP